MSNLYLFELGRLSHLSRAELDSLLGEDNFVEIVDHFAIYKLEHPLENPQTLQNKLGGTIKIAEIAETFESKPSEKQITSALEEILKDHFVDKSGKIPFAISTFNTKSINPKTQIFLKSLLNFSKKTIKSLGFNSRFVNKPWSNATSAQIFKSNSVSKGIDIMVLSSQTSPKTYIAKTLAIQDINSYSYRDYKKPFRDPRMGMLPPKLSQIMINLAESSLDEPLRTIYDPFCGSGTILIEALLQGKDAIGSDLDEKAVEGTLSNLYWVTKNFENTPKEFVVFHKDAQEIIEKDLPGPPDAIVTETHLGPPVSKMPKEENLQKTLAALSKLHENWLTNINPFLEVGTKIVMCLPAFRKSRNEHIRLINFPQIAKKAGFKPSNKEPLIYDRPDQVVAREIVVLKKS
jgi:tRNA G10  N-methylase Trm11